MSSEQPKKPFPSLVIVGGGAPKGVGNCVSETSCCCGPPQVVEVIQQPLCACQSWMDGSIQTPVAIAPLVRTDLRMSDILGGWKVRWGIGRMRYTITPGLYAVGQPDRDSPVLVSANYRLSFDCLRKELGGLNAWILVIDTKGINVWCAAGKGTFGTDEIVGRVKANHLDEIVSHRTLIVPQLGAPGVAAHEVTRRCGFRVVYGPVRAKDILDFLAAGMKATAEMREVRFRLADRAAVIPVELVYWGKWALLAAACLLLLAGLNRNGYSFDSVLTTGSASALAIIAAYLTGTAVFPVVLPWLPGRAFSLKGLWIGLVLLVMLFAAMPVLCNNWQAVIGWILVIPAVTSFVAMGFTGSTTYTSLSGVRREARWAVPIQFVCVVLGAAAEI